MPELIAVLERALESGGSMYSSSLSSRSDGRKPLRKPLRCVPCLLERSTYPNVRLKAAQCEERGVRQSAIRAPGELGEASAKTLLLNLLQNDSGPNTCLNAAKAVAGVGTASSVPMLESLLNTEKVPGVTGAIRRQVGEKLPASPEVSGEAGKGEGYSHLQGAAGNASYKGAHAYREQRNSGRLPITYPASVGP